MSGQNYYQALYDIENQRLEKNSKKLAELTKAQNEAVASGKIEKFSDAWYEMTDKINSTTEAIQEGKIALVEYADTIKKIDWEVFEFLQKRISGITSESEFLINLLSNQKLYTDKGQLTDEGKAVMGLHGVSYNTYMEQSKAYAEELLKINEDLAKDPYNTELIEKKEELIGLQQDSILAAEQEKQSMIDLVEEGINKELDALKELIDAYTESMD